LAVAHDGAEVTTESNPDSVDTTDLAALRASGGDKAKQLVIYCQADCWMSWNAAKRALSLGYSNVAWYRDGTDGWSAAGLPMQNATPEPRPDE